MNEHEKYHEIKMWPETLGGEGYSWNEELAAMVEQLFDEQDIEIVKAQVKGVVMGFVTELARRKLAEAQLVALQADNANMETHTSMVGYLREGTEKF